MGTEVIYIREIPLKNYHYSLSVGNLSYIHTESDDANSYTFSCVLFKNSNW